MQSEVLAIYAQTFVTLLVGTVAWIIYHAQKKDSKKDAASSILLEIQGGEAAVSKVRDAIQNEHLDIDISVLPSESWSKNKHLFVRDFDKDEWESISDFYNKTALIDDAIKYNKTAFASNVEQIRTNKQRVLAAYAEEAVNKAVFTKDKNSTQEIEQDYELKARIFDELYMQKQSDFEYKPLKPINDVKLYLADLPKLTTSSVGMKLKKISGSEK